MKFKYICDLLDSLEEVESAPIPWPRREKDERYKRHLQVWFDAHRTPIDDEVALLSCLLPERRVDRVYSMQRPRFTKAMSECLCLGVNVAKNLRSTPEGSDLAKMLESIVRDRGGGFGQIAVTITELDRCLASLAAISRWSAPKVRSAREANRPHTQREILNPIVSRLTAREMKWFVRIFFKRLDPVQFKYNSILRYVNPLLPAMLKVSEAFDDALEILNNPRLKAYLDENGSNIENIPKVIRDECFRPRIGAKVGRPLFLKARSFKHCAKMVGNRRWSIEPKYDGEFCQLHVDVTQEPPKIQIFSKSGKDSTKDRASVHNWITQTLRLGADCRFKRQCIIEGEIVVVDVRDNSVLGFEKIRKHVSRSGSFLGTNQDSAPHGYEQLRILFYDALLIDDEVLIYQPYEERRRKLSILLPNSSGYSIRAHWCQIDFSKYEDREKQRQLIHKFQRAHLSRFEGLVLKPLDGAYHSLLPRLNDDYTGTVIKLKADYIPGLGDSADMAIIGAYSSDHHQVEPELLRATKCTHFVLACLKNKDDVLLHQAKPAFKIMGSVSRPAISADDMRYLSQHGHFRAHTTVEFDVELSGNERSPRALFNRPFVVDVVGSKFERPANTDYWMLRHPRVTRIHVDRFAEDVVSFDELQSLAKQAPEIPENESLEASKFMEQIRKVSEPKRPQFVNTHSPFSTRTSTISSASVRSSRTANTVLVRVDNCEMRPENERFVAPLVSTKKENLQASRQAAPPLSKHIDKVDKEATKTEPENTKTNKTMLAALEQDKATPSTAQAGNSRTTQTLHFSPRQERGQKRKTNLQASISPPKRRSIVRSESDPSANRHTGGAARQQDIKTDTSIHHLASSRLQPRQPLDNPNPTALASKTTQPPQPPQHSHRRLQRSKSTPMAQPPNITSSEGPESSHPSLWVHQPRPVFPVELTRGNPLRNATVLLAPTIPKDGLVEAHYLNLFEPGGITRDMNHWRRERLPFVSSRESVVEESQFDPGCHKLVLVENFMRDETDKFIGEVMKMRLGAYEQVDVWDWRALEVLTEMVYIFDEGTGERERYDLLKADLQQRYFVGMVRNSTFDEKKMIEEKGLKDAIKMVGSLRSVQRSEITEAQEGNESLINVLKWPANSELWKVTQRWANGESIERHSMEL